MTGFADAPFEIDCPKCRKKIQTKLSRLRANNELRCTCGAVFVVKGDEFRRYEAARKKLARQLAKLSTTIKLKL